MFNSLNILWHISGTNSFTQWIIKICLSTCDNILIYIYPHVNKFIIWWRTPLMSHIYTQIHTFPCHVYCFPFFTARRRLYSSLASADHFVPQFLSLHNMKSLFPFPVLSMCCHLQVLSMPHRVIITVHWVFVLISDICGGGSNLSACSLWHRWEPWQMGGDRWD